MKSIDFVGKSLKLSIKHSESTARPVGAGVRPAVPKTQPVVEIIRPVFAIVCPVVNPIEPVVEIIKSKEPISLARDPFIELTPDTVALSVARPPAAI